jgi:hypothetical protein
VSDIGNGKLHLARRDAIVELEQQITMVETLIDRQKTRSKIVVLPQDEQRLLD